MNHDRAINASQIHACLRIVNQASYFFSSPAAVSIWKPPQRRRIKAISHNIQSIQLMALFMMLTRLLHWFAHAHPNPT
jgi:hypothetical protein